MTDSRLVCVNKHVGYNAYERKHNKDDERKKARSAFEQEDYDSCADLVASSGQGL